MARISLSGDIPRSAALHGAAARARRVHRAEPGCTVVTALARATSRAQPPARLTFHSAWTRACTGNTQEDVMSYDTNEVRVLGIAVSLRSGAYNRMLLRAAVELAPDDMRIDVFDLASVPLYNADLDNDGQRPEGAQALKNSIAAADAVLSASPEYNHSVPGVL